MSCDPETLVNDARCFTCVPPDRLSAIQIYLLCQIASGGIPVGPHDLLSATHPDTLPGPPTRGALVVGNATPKWAALTLGAANRVLRSDGIDSLWAQVALGTDVTGQLPLANGGTNNNITADPGAVVYSTAVALALTPSGNAGQLLQSFGLASPDWTASTYPSASGAAGNILISDGANWQSVAMSADATIAASGVLTLATVNANVGSFGAAATVGTFTVNAKGLITAAANVAIAIDASQITSGTLPIARGGTNSGTALNNNRIMVSSAGAIVEAAALTDGQLLIGSTGAAPVAASLTAGTNIVITPGPGSITIATTGLVGTHTVLDATVHTDTVTQTVTRGSIIVGNSTPKWDELVLGGSGTVLRSNGTDLVYSTFTIPDTYTTGDIIYASATNVFSALADVSAGSYLRSGGVATAPLWSTVKIPNTANTGDLWQGTASNTITALASVAAGSYLRSGGVTTASVWSTLTLPNTSSQGDLFYSTAANAMIVLNKNTTATRYLSNRGTNNDPLWSLVRLTDGVEGILPVGNGGTGTSTTFTQGSVIFAGPSGVYAQDNPNFYWDDTNNRLGIGVSGASVLYRFHLIESFTSTASNELSFRVDTTWTPSAASANFVSAGQCACTKAGTQNITHEMGIRGLYMSANNTGSGTVTGECAFYSWVLNQGTGTVTSAVHYFCETPLAALANPITNTYGIYIKAQSGTGITNSWAVYSAGASDNSYFAGRVGIQTTVAPTSLLQILPTPNDMGSYSLSSWNATGERVTAFFKAPTENGGVTPNAAMPAIILGRNGAAAVTYPNFAEFKLRRWETGNNPRASTALDIALTDGNAVAAGTDILSILSNGCVGIGTTQPNAKLHLAAGTTTARTAPLQFTISGSDALATPVAGTVETDKDDNDNLFYTITTGTARKEFVFADPSGGLTSGRVPFATTNGRLTDSANLLYAGATGIHVGADSDLCSEDIPLFSVGSSDCFGSPVQFTWIGSGGPLYEFQVMNNNSSSDFAFHLISALFVDAQTELYSTLLVDGAVSLTNKITTYNNVATEGYGVPAIVDNVALTGQVANIASTNFTNAGTVGTYQINCYMVCTTADAAAGTITLTLAYNDGTAARAPIGAVVNLTATNASSSISFARLGSGSISYSVTIAGGYGTAVYSLFISVERLS